MTRKGKKARAAQQTLRSSERLVFAFHEKDSPTGVRRETVKKLASQLSMTETRFLHLGAALLVEKLKRESRGAAPDDKSRRRSVENARLTDAQIDAIRTAVPQDRIATTTFLDLLNEPD